MTELESGFLIVREVITPLQCEHVIAELLTAGVEGVGSRALMRYRWCANLASSLMSHPQIAALLPEGAVPVQCTLFDKTPENNWLVGRHQDLSIPVAERVASADCRAWSQKEGMTFVQPPVEVLETLLAVRLQVDECSVEDGPLRVVPNSHRHGRLSAAEIAQHHREQGEIVCAVPRGGALIMRPLLLHASSKGSEESPRRVLHFLYGPSQLPCGLQWPRSRR